MIDAEKENFIRTLKCWLIHCIFLEIIVTVTAAGNYWSKQQAKFALCLSSTAVHQLAGSQSKWTTRSRLVSAPVSRSICGVFDWRFSCTVLLSYGTAKKVVVHCAPRRIEDKNNVLFFYSTETQGTICSTLNYYLYEFVYNIPQYLKCSGPILTSFPMGATVVSIIDHFFDKNVCFFCEINAPSSSRHLWK